MPPDSPDSPDQQSPEVALNAQINAAVTGQLKRALAKQAEEFKTLMAEQFKAFKPVATPPEEQDPKVKTPDPALAAMRAQLEQMQSTVKEAESRREKAEAKQREDKAFSDLKDSLKSKVRPDLLDTQAQNLFYANKRVEFDADGTPLFKVRRSTGGLDEDVLMPLSDGVSTFLSSKEAAPFLPAPVPGGTQQTRGAKMPTVSPTAALGSNGLPKYDKPATTDAEKIRRAMEVEQSIVARQKGQ